MINPKRLIEMARKSQKIAATRRRRILFQRLDGGETAEQGLKSVARKGHFVVYTTDRRRFVVPLECLSSSIFRELLRMSEEEFGLPSNGPITLPCDSIFMEYVVSLIRGSLSKDEERALLLLLSSGRCSSSSHFQGQINHDQPTDTSASFLKGDVEVI